MIDMAVGVDNGVYGRVSHTGNQLAYYRARCRHARIDQHQPFLGLKHHHVDQRQVDDPGIGRHPLNARELPRIGYALL